MANRIWFAQLLRGFAALFVVFDHLFKMFWKEPGVVAGLLNTQPIFFKEYLGHFYITDFFSPYNFIFGPYGVGIFFIISGFVIPMSLEKVAPGNFLIGRIFRIYPVYIIGLGITCFAVFLFKLFMGEEYTITFTSYLFNALLIGDLAGIPSIDGANWTLVIEIKFYILCGVLSIFTNLRSKKVVLCVPLLMTIVCLLLCSNYDKLYSYNSILHKLAYIFSTNAMFIILMFTGICIYNYHQGNWRRKDFIILLILLVLFFIISVYCNPNSSQIDYLLVSNLMALITFMCCFLFRKKLKYNKYIDFFAKISYPLYVVHGKTGYITMYLVYNSVLANAYVAIFVALSLVILIAYLIHILIEVPSINFGRVVTSRLANFKT